MMNKKAEQKPRRGAPKKEVRRTEKINFTVTPAEKNAIVKSANEAGISEHSVYVRAIVLKHIKPKE